MESNRNRQPRRAILLLWLIDVKKRPFHGTLHVFSRLREITLLYERFVVLFDRTVQSDWDRIFRWTNWAECYLSYWLYIYDWIASPVRSRRWLQPDVLQTKKPTIKVTIIGLMWQKSSNPDCPNCTDHYMIRADMTETDWSHQQVENISFRTADSSTSSWQGPSGALAGSEPYGCWFSLRIALFRELHRC